MHKAIDRLRDQTSPRKAMHKAIDKIRDQKSSRKAMHKAIDKLRNQKESRKLNLRNHDKKESRMYYIKKRNDLRYQKQLLNLLLTDTGFDAICICCLQYKNKNLCKLVQDQMKLNYGTFFVKQCYLLKKKNENQYICNMCFGQIKQGKVPKRSQVSRYKFANFPISFIHSLKRSCTFKEQQYNKAFQEEKEIYERKALELNRLESYLLKRVIPFVRIAHCPRGPYLKLKGDLILISSNIEHSMSRILPVEQHLIPVSFKRKLAYSGYYIEEIVEKDKVKLYLEWFKRHNHLYKDVEIDSNLMESFQAQSLESTSEFENITRGDIEKCSSLVDNDIDDDVQEIFCADNFDQPLEIHETNDSEYTHIKTSIFMNKYSDDCTLPTVANKVAEMICILEQSNQIAITDENDFEIDDEYIDEEEFMSKVQELNSQKELITKQQDVDICLDEEKTLIEITDQLDENKLI